MKKILQLITVVAMTMLISSCGGCNRPLVSATSEQEQAQPAKSGRELLLERLRELLPKGIMFGAQIPTEYGLSGGSKWYDDGSCSKSDTKILTGSHPAVCGWDISEIELDHPKNIDGEDFGTIRKHIVAAYSRGAVNTISWHCANPVTGGNSWDNTPAAGTVAKGGANHDKFISWLDKVATFLGSIKTEDGTPVPLIFRPWHEHTGNGFWWGKGSATAEEFKAMWKLTVDYLKVEKGMDNLVFAYSPDAIHFIWDPISRARDIYMEFWPGDDYVDIIGLDAYDAQGRRFSEYVPQLTNLICDMAAEKGKIAAVTETGIENNNPAHSSYTNENWWTEVLYPAIHGRALSFVLMWRNGGFPSEGSHYFNAYKGCYTEADFLKFASKEDILLESCLQK